MQNYICITIVYITAVYITTVYITTVYSYITTVSLYIIYTATCFNIPCHHLGVPHLCLVYLLTYSMEHSPS